MAPRTKVRIGDAPRKTINPWEVDMFFNPPTDELKMQVLTATKKSYNMFKRLAYDTLVRLHKDINMLIKMIIAADNKLPIQIRPGEAGEATFTSRTISKMNSDYRRVLKIFFTYMRSGPKRAGRQSSIEDLSGIFEPVLLGPLFDTIFKADLIGATDLVSRKANSAAKQKLSQTLLEDNLCTRADAFTILYLATYNSNLDRVKDHMNDEALSMDAVKEYFQGLKDDKKYKLSTIKTYLNEVTEDLTYNMSIRGEFDRALNNSAALFDVQNKRKFMQATDEAAPSVAELMETNSTDEKGNTTKEQYSGDGAFQLAYYAKAVSVSVFTIKELTSISDGEADSFWLSDEQAKEKLDLIRTKAARNAMIADHGKLNARKMTWREVKNASADKYKSSRAVAGRAYRAAKKDLEKK